VPISHESVLYDVHDCKVYPLTSDTAASPVYGTAVDVPGIANAALNPNLVGAELKGDGRVIARKGRVDRYNVSLTYGKLDLDVLEVVLGGTVEDTGETQARLRLYSNQRLPDFGVGLSIEDTDTGIGCVHVFVHKAQITGGTLLGQSSDAFGQPTMEVQGRPLDSTDADYTDLMVTFDYHDDLTPLPATPP
jgi:hypothetical protein